MSDGKIGKRVTKFMVDILYSMRCDYQFDRDHKIHSSPFKNIELSVNLHVEEVR